MSDKRLVFGEKINVPVQRHISGEWWYLLITENPPISRLSKFGYDIRHTDYNFTVFATDATTGKPVDLLVIHDMSRDELRDIRDAINWILGEG